MDSKKLKLCYLALTPIPSRTAYSVHVMKMCQALANSNCAVQLVSPKMHDIEKNINNAFEFYGVDPVFEHLLYRMPNIKGGAYLYALSVYKLIKQQKPDFVYGRFLFGIFLSALSGIPSALEMHSPISDAGKVSVILFKRLIKLKAFKQLVVISNALKEWYVNNYPDLIGIISVAHDGADELREVGRISFNNDKRLQVGYIGQLYSGKGLEVIEIIAPLCPWANFHVIGGTEDDIKNWEPRLNFQNVTLYGYKAHSEVSRYQASFDVLIAPYQTQVKAYGGKGDLGRWMSPLKIFEYMAAGKAMLVSDLEVLKEILVNEETALLCAPTDYEDWVNQLLRLKESESLREKLGSNALKKFKESYTWSKRATCLKEKIVSWSSHY